MNRLIRILYVDDNPLDRELVRDALEKEQEGFLVTEASSCREFEAHLDKGGFDLVLSDFNILGFEGLQVIETVRARDPELPVVIVTGTGSEEIAVEALRSGATDYVIKSPRHIQRLPLTIHAVLERHKLQGDKARAEAAFKNLVNNAPIGIFIVQHGRFRLVNPRFLSIAGCPEAELLGRDALSLVAPEFREAVREQILKMVRGERLTPFEFQIITPDGQRRWLMESVSPTLYAGDKAVLGYCTDITEHKQMTNQFLQAQKMEAVGRLAGGVAHDFNNMLMAIMGYAEVMMQELHQDDPLYHSVAEITRAAERAASLTRQLLAFSRKQILEHRVINLNAVFSSMENMLQRLLGEDIELILALDPQVAAVKTDPGQMEQVIMNLAVNARDAMPRGGKLIIETSNVYLDEIYAQAHAEVTPGPHVRLAISDNGMGIAPEAMPYLFEPFYTTKEVGKGTGLGLSTVYGIAKQSGGHITVYSEPGGGATFKIYLPQAVEAAQAVKIAIPITLPEGSETILVVEDEDLLRGLIVRILHLYGYQTIEARNGGEAILACERHQEQIHLLLTDVVMPQMSGRELAERLCTLHPEMKVLFMSGYTVDAVIQHGIREEKTAFIQKPFRPLALASKVREVLDVPVTN
jgi:PAS domain S-box-containing protein